MSRPTLRAPAGQGQILAVPPLAGADALLAANETTFRGVRRDLFGLSLSEVRDLARSEIAAAARRFMSRVGLDAIQESPRGFVVTGHQPDLFHPGVWIKNFAACGLARKRGLAGLNLLIDNDNIKTTLVKTPRLTPTGAELARVPLDRWIGPLPFEELAVQDEAMFRAFPDAVSSLATDWPFQPLVGELWKLVGTSRHLGERLAVGRHRLEERWGCRNLELPLSALCQTRTFARFACHILADLPHFHQVYNQELTAYRKRHHIKSKHHPVPDLGSAGDWLEAPFWVWRTGEAQRSRLLVRRLGDAVELRHGTTTFARLTIRAQVDDLVAQFLAVGREGFKIRTRALTTTLFVRLCVADLFIHGIGGAIYDELTDAILRGYFGLEPPRFLTLSATLRLPFPVPTATSDDLRLLRSTMRDLHYKPERALAQSPVARVRELALAKRAWVAQAPAEAAAKIGRWRTLQQLNAELRGYLADKRARLEHQLVHSTRLLEASKLLNDREYAFCLHPEPSLRGLVDDLQRLMD